jgi:hypothetical protein
VCVWFISVHFAVAQLRVLYSLVYTGVSQISIYIYASLCSDIRINLLDIITKHKNTCRLEAAQGILQRGCAVRFLGCRKFH